MRRVAASLAGCRLAAQLSVPGVFPLPLDSFRPFSGRRISFPENPAPLPFPPSPSDPVRLFSTKASSVEAAAAEDGDGQALLNSALEAELRESLSGRQLQRLAEAALVRGLREPRLWSLLSQKAMVLNAAGPLPDSAEKGTPPEGEEDKAVKPSAPRPFRFFEALNFLGCFCAAGFRDADLVRSFIPLLLRQMSEMEPRHLLQFLQICEEQRQRQREVYTQLLRVLGSCAQRMYFSETADALCCFAAYRVGSSSCFRSVLRAASEQMRNSTLRECCRVAGALRSLGFSEAVGESEKNTTSSTASCPAKTQSACSLEEAAAAFLVLLNERVSFLTEALPVQLLMDEVQGLHQLEFSWRPFEEQAQTALLDRLKNMEGHADVEELADPFSALQFLYAKNWVSTEFLKALVKWAKAAVHLPATRSYKRPTAEELVFLHDLCREHGIEDDPALQKALVKFVSTKGGTSRHPRFVSPLEYQKGRKYFYFPDLRHNYKAAKARSQD